MPANHTPTPAQSWIVRLARVCWERKKLSVIVVVASVSTILLAALTPLLTRQAVNDALAGNPARLPWLACGLLLIAFFDFIGNYVRRGYAGMLSLWVQHTLRGRVFDSIQKLDGAGQDALRTGQVISRTNSDLQQVHTLLQMCPVPLAVFTYYIAGIAVMLWMSPAMTLIVVCVLVCLAITALRARRRVFAQTGLASDQLANLTEHIREVLAQISVVNPVWQRCVKRTGSIGSRGRLCVYASVRLSRRRCLGPPCWRYRCSGKSSCCATAGGRSCTGGSISVPSLHSPASSRC